MTNSIENIYSDFRTNYVDKPDFTIDFFEKNSIYFNCIKQLNNKEELRLYIQLVCKYAEANYYKDHFNIAVDIVNKQQPFIDNEIHSLNANDLKDDWYYYLQFVKGMASYRLRDYKTSTPIFKKLVEYDTKNDNFKNWLRNSLYGKRMWISTTIIITCIALVTIDIIFGNYIPSFIVRISFVGVALTGLFVTGFYYYYLKRSRRKSQLK